MNPLESVVSLWPSAFARADQTPDKNLSLAEIMRGIRDGARRAEIERLRALFASDPEAYQVAKRKLPAFAASGRFAGRSAKALLEHSGCILLDFDHFDDIAGVRERACADPHVMLCFLSPSGDGLKVGVRVPKCADAAAHKHAWEVVTAYAAVWGADAKADEACKDTSRLCFVSYDPDGFVNPNAVELAIPDPEPVIEQSRAAAKKKKKGKGSERIDEAVSRFNSAHIVDWGAPGKGECPVCKKAGRFGNAGGGLAGSGRWACWGQTHFQHNIGICGGAFHHGDALDIEAFKAGRERLEHLVAEGYLPEPEESDDAVGSARALVGTDLWFARRFAAEHGAETKYVATWNSWMVYDETEGRWERDKTNAAVRRGVQTAEGILRAAVALPYDSDERKQLWGAGAAFQKRKNLSAGLGLAIAMQGVYERPEAFDTDQMLLNCRNGVIELTTGEFREHRKSDLITLTNGVEFDPEAKCPIWDRFLAEILPGADLRDYIQRAIGYSATGLVREDVVHIAHGGGSNGKSVFFSAICAALGEYAVNVPPALLMQTRQSEHPTLQTTLRGKRLALAAETAEGGRFDEARLKALSGRDKISARGMRENYYEFDPTHKLWLQTNHKPRVREDTHAFWRRIRLLPFTVKIPDERQDKKLPEKLMAELPGILQWIRAGVAAYLEHGLTPPAEVLAATAEYEKEQDELAEFRDMYQPGGFTSSENIHKEYMTWAVAQGIKPIGLKGLSAKLKAKGWEPLKVKRGPRGFAVTYAPDGAAQNPIPDSYGNSTIDLDYHSLRGYGGETRFESGTGSEPASNVDSPLGENRVQSGSNGGNDPESDIGDMVDRWVDGEI